MRFKKVLTAVFIIASCFFMQEKTFGQVNNPVPTDTLTVYRSQIDELDKQIIALLGQRMQLAEKVGIYKAQHHLPALQQKRFDAILQKNIELGRHVNLSETFITEMMHAIHKESLQKENAIQASYQKE